MYFIIGLFSNSFVAVGQMFPNTWSFIPQVLVFLVPLFGRIVPYIRSINSEHSPFCVFSVSLILLSSLYLHIGIPGCSDVCILIYSSIQALECLYTCIPVYRPICICGYTGIQVCTYPAVSIYANTDRYANTRIRDSAYQFVFDLISI